MTFDKTCLTLSLLLTFLSLVPASGLSAPHQTGKTAGRPAQHPPFLIIGRLPHLTKVIKQNWNNPDLALTSEQKKELLVVRQDTMDAVARLKKKIQPLESKVVEKSDSGVPPEEIAPLVRSIADLKAEASMVHLQCLYRTRTILNAKQKKILRDITLSN